MTEPPVPPSGVRGTPRPRASRRNLVGIALVVLAALALAFSLSHCAKDGGDGSGGGRVGRGGARGGPGGRPPITVGSAKATLGAVPIELGALGTVTPEATVNVNARVSGMLLSVAFREGQVVRKGQLLAQIDPRPFQVTVQQAQGQLLHDQALLQNAKLDLARFRTLKSQDSIAGQQVDTQAALVKQDEATVSTDHATVASAQLNLSFTHITAPVGGRVGLRQIDPGNQIAANATTPIAVVTQVDPIDVVFALPESAIPAVTRHGAGGAARQVGGLPVTALDRGGAAVLARGALFALDSVIDATTGTVKAKARFSNGAGALFANQFVNVVVLVDTLPDQVLVPTSAVRHGPQGDFVWVLQADRTVTARTVRVGAGTGETVSIQSGLGAGEAVITEGGDRLRDGGKVVLPGLRAPTGGGGFGPGGRHHRRGGGAPTGPQ